MNPPPRKAKIPAHIKAAQLPTGVWWAASGKGKWMFKFKDGDKWRSKRIAGPDATLPQIWRAVEENQKPAPRVVTFASLSLEFQQTPIWRRLAITTQRDYLDCHAQICGTTTKSGALLGDANIAAWTVGVVRQYRDTRGEQSPSRANKELAYIKRLFAWAYEYEKIAFNPADGVKKLTVKPRQHYAEDKDYFFMLDIARASPYWYVPVCMELAYRCRMRLAEVLDLTDANDLPEGLLVKRRKNSRDNIVKWTPALRAIWDAAAAKRNRILADRKQPHPIKADQRYLFISERTGDRIQVSSLKTALSRIGQTAEEEAAKRGIDFVRFTFHDLKKKGVTETIGDKQRASGHRSASMMNIYDLELAVVDPAGKNNGNQS
ncbi:tyrosine recombinase XerC [Methylomonas koyamae]|uniref:site-specific integrase n=1 Tax=Methylomonas koyamae TaxID=702114 RepID=UPI00112737E9|nr:tyrosine-type recombinase/integrase [Methylomonas koyamae]TPQ24901.1 hypothetical protein C2U68_17135 [Methylomonas koyamae]